MPTNKYFYYSEEDCTYIEVERSLKSLIGKATLGVAVAIVITIGLMRVIGGSFLVSADTERLQAEVGRLTDRLNRINTSLRSLASSDSVLRSAVNLPVASAEERALATGGNRLSMASVDMPTALITASNEVIERLSMQVEQQQKSYEEIISKYEVNQKLFACVPAIKPITGERTSGFGMRMHPIYRIFKFHSGQDFHAPIGTAVFATGDGVIESAEFNSGYGNLVVIDHGFGYKTSYAHLSKFHVKAGEKIKRGQQIAESGNTGVSDGPHLHYEVMKDGTKQNPEGYLFDEMTPAAFNRALAAQPAPADSALQGE